MDPRFTTTTTTDDREAGRKTGRRMPGEGEPPPPPVSPPGIRKPLPARLFAVHGTNAETRWEALRGEGDLTPDRLFFVRNHTSTPLIDAGSWRLTLWGSGLRGGPVSFTYRDLLAMPAEEVTAFLECAGNGRSLYGEQQGEEVSGTPWRLGAVGVARWRGVPLAALLGRAGMTARAVALMPRGLDPDYVEGGENLGRVRRPLPVTKALDDVLVAYEMNGRPLPPDHGFPARLAVPGWAGIAWTKWLGDVEVSAEQLESPWSSRLYRMHGPGHPPGGGPPLTRMGVKSAFELPWPARLRAGHGHLLHGRSWSGNGRVVRVDVSDDDGVSWRPAHLHGDSSPRGWVRWTFRWTPLGAGAAGLLARAVDETGAGQPERATSNRLGYAFDAVVRHPVVVT
ncbi:molybdopterin-dependent oxidoreductase [Microbispora sp. NBC_01189]|uniref:molybdopterin-dependent oxidoreductase n=1 Tax=Microbispora sp. NBC_01189 TaxID=2903583 RepID=UPI002E10B3DF|nr:molybdopterin-dependent oxidoreductase [Microbispora sp. NBC_01189]